MNTINALKIRTKLGGILDNVAKKGEYYIIERMGKPMAVLVPYYKFDHEKENQNQRQLKIQKAINQISSWREKNSKKFSKEDSVEIIRRTRDERTKHLLDVIEGR